MANVLGELFGNIATAIREKTGDEGKMKPAEFPEKIAAIETGGGSGGGGTLPAGVYWESILPKMPKNYRGYHFMYKGTLYLVQETSSSSTSVVNFYKFNGNQYVEVLSNATVNHHQYGIEFNGKFHFVGANSTGSPQHVSFDGASVTQYATLPKSIGSGRAFVENSKLKGVGTDNKVYEWDEATDTWTDTGVSIENYGKLFYHDGKLYRYYLKKIYLHEGNTSTVVREGLLNNDFIAYKDGKIYSTTNDGGTGEVYVYDFATDTESKIGSSPKLGLYFSSYVYDGKIRVTGGNDVVTNHLVMHIVEATE